MGEDQDKCPGPDLRDTHTLSLVVCLCLCLRLCLWCNEYLETVGKACCSSRDCRHFVQRSQVTETLGQGSRAGNGGEVVGKREASVQCGVPARAMAPAGVECGGARQLCIREGATPSVDLWPMIVTKITQPSFQRLNVF